MPSRMTIKSVREATRDGATCEATLAAQAEKITRKETAAGKPFYELILRDATDSLTIDNFRVAYARVAVA